MNFWRWSMRARMKHERPRRSKIPKPARDSKARQPHPSARWGTASVFAIPAFTIVYLAVAFAWGVPGWMAMAYIMASIVCFGAYAADKSAAVSGGWRISERNLLLLGLAGGWPGAIVAQQSLRHKSSKASFRLVFWATVALNVAGFVAINSPLVQGPHGGLLLRHLSSVGDRSLATFGQQRSASPLAALAFSNPEDQAFFT